MRISCRVSSKSARHSRGVFFGAPRTVAATGSGVNQAWIWLQGTRENWVFPEGWNCGYTNSVTFGTPDLRILIVDDSETTRRILRAIVHSRDWKVCGEAETGRSGITKFQELKPDLVLIDLAMPDINGIEAAKRMSTLNPRVPLILFTVLDLQGLEKAALEAGIWAIVSKAQAWNLIKTIETAVGTFGGASAS